MSVPGKLEFEEVGYITLDVAGKEVKGIDLFDLFNKLYACGEGRPLTAEASAQTNADRVAILKGLGFPEMSHMTACRILDGLNAAVDAAKKNDRWRGFAETHATTGSPSGSTEQPATPPA